MESGKPLLPFTNNDTLRYALRLMHLYWRILFGAVGLDTM